ncbi:bifunctional diguanylate cyclase/phosphodiesterase [Shewanella sp. JM162201]|uniref:Bifunctional diguanylate cyclase/phosphodiesterase n=1 Tax=Shewanella jiangmenensis TaxID=2837387 RepID=A0ABS5V4P6_9GAMM|nr:bifunctional diguanylate cyclase/phosphodiesterase [Shewanella jiangmenensis]MBT1444649.1 bifunctional diguanylate cyclase/phosphodiesterase [Shewanella jiangmenensis]
MTIVSQLKGLASRRLVFSLIFFTMVIVVTAAIFVEYTEIHIQLLCLLYGLLMSIAWFSKDLTRLFSTLGALVLLLFICLSFPLDMELIEEAFLLVPLQFVMLFPSSLWPLAVAPLLLLTYLPATGLSTVEQWFEDAMELLTIGSFACVMSYFHAKSKAQIDHFSALSRTDDLTQLGNRKAFREQMTTLFSRHKSKDLAGFALIMLDVDGFKRINDQYGHSGGDQLLRELAQRLSRAENHATRAFRIGGDEFALLLELSASGMAGEARTEAEILQEALEQPYRIFNHLLNIKASLGIAIVPWDCIDPESLCRHADLALYSAKRQLGNGIAFFDDGLHQDAIRGYEIERHLQSAIEGKEFFLEYQPKVCLQSGEIKGVEALLRWRSDVLGLVSPAQFIPLAEANGSIVEIGRWVMFEACAQLKRWQQRYPGFFLSVNISMVQVQRDDLLALVDDAIAISGIEPGWLELELTETAVMASPEEYITMLKALKSRGLRLALDDFGVAYSSLAYLARLPVDTLKVDKSFVDRCLESRPDRLIIRTIVQLAANLGMVTVAEGVETEEQRKVLEAEGVDRYQGYLFSRPVAASKIEALLDKSLQVKA